MTLQMRVDLAQVISASAVTLTLLAVLVSIRQNTRSQKALAVDSLAAAITSINVPAMQSHTLGSALSRTMADWSSASREERIIAHYFLFSFFKLLENAWYQQKTGIQSSTVAWMGDAAAKILSRRWSEWELVSSRKQAYSPEFQKFLSGIKSPDDLGSLNDLSDYVQNEV